MKILKFRKRLSQLILCGEKTVTWRLFDDKNLQKGEVVSFMVWETGKKFANVKILEVTETTFAKLKKEDFEGHEPFSSMDEVYDRFSLYYHRPIYPHTSVKILRFSLVKKFK